MYPNDVCSESCISKVLEAFHLSSVTSNTLVLSFAMNFKHIMHVINS